MTKWDLSQGFKVESTHENCIIRIKEKMNTQYAQKSI